MLELVSHNNCPITSWLVEGTPLSNNSFDFGVSWKDVSLLEEHVSLDGLIVVNLLYNNISNINIYYNLTKGGQIDSSISYR